MPVGADLKLTCGFLPADTWSLPPGQAAIASFAGCVMHASAADAGLVVTAHAATASVPAAARSACSTSNFDCFISISVPPPRTPVRKRCLPRGLVPRGEPLRNLSLAALRRHDLPVEAQLVAPVLAVERPQP